jgi:hypothetical protein
MSPAAVFLTVGAIADIVGIGVIVWWIASRKRLAAETVGRADEQVRAMRAQAERDADSLKKEAHIEARERSHLLLADAE